MFEVTYYSKIDTFWGQKRGHFCGHFRRRIAKSRCRTPFSSFFRSKTVKTTLSLAFCGGKSRRLWAFSPSVHFVLRLFVGQNPPFFPRVWLLSPRAGNFSPADTARSNSFVKNIYIERGGSFVPRAKCVFELVQLWSETTTSCGATLQVQVGDQNTPAIWSCKLCCTKCKM